MASPAAFSIAFGTTGVEGFVLGVGVRNEMVGQEIVGFINALAERVRRGLADGGGGGFEGLDVGEQVLVLVAEGLSGKRHSIRPFTLPTRLLYD